VFALRCPFPQQFCSEKEGRAVRFARSIGYMKDPLVSREPGRKPSRAKSRAAAEKPRGQTVEPDYKSAITTFLRDHPRSSLLKIVLHLWPDFLRSSPEVRSAQWSRAKGELEEMQLHWQVVTSTDERRTTLWSLDQR
jgi:hypothetical protein